MSIDSASTKGRITVLVGKFNSVWQTILSVLTALYLSVLIGTLSPPGLWQERLLDLTGPFWRYTRLDQNWRLFSPQLSRTNQHATTIITFEDGSKALFELPRMDRLSQLGRFKDEKFRKWSVDCLPTEKYKQYWPDTARYIGRRFYNEHNKPQALSLGIWWSDIPPPTAGKGPDDLPVQSNYSPLFQYRFAPGDFK